MAVPSRNSLYLNADMCLFGSAFLSEESALPSSHLTNTATIFFLHFTDPL